LKRLELLRNNPELKDKLWENVHALQNGLRKGFNRRYKYLRYSVYLEGSVPEAMVMRLRYPVIPKGMILLRVILLRIH
jgi:glycine C-acetyltransferase